LASLVHLLPHHGSVKTHRAALVPDNVLKQPRLDDQARLPKRLTKLELRMPSPTDTVPEDKAVRGI